MSRSKKNHPRPGDHIRIARSFYTHHGIYMGDDGVIHFTGDLKNRRGAKIRRTSLSRFLGGQPKRDLEIVQYGKCHSRKRVVKRAERRLGEDGYSVFGNNCEHFARWCVTGRHESRQVARVVRIAGAVCLAAGTAATAAGVVVARTIVRRMVRRRA